MPFFTASVSSFGTLFGCILSGYLCDRLGRKKTLIVLQWPAIMGWLMIGFAPSIQWIYVGRILVGISSGMVGAPSRVYVAEISQPYIRGMLAGFSSVGVSLGMKLKLLTIPYRHNFFFFFFYRCGVGIYIWRDV